MSANLGNPFFARLGASIENAILSRDKAILIMIVINL